MIRNSIIVLSILLVVLAGGMWIASFGSRITAHSSRVGDFQYLVYFESGHCYLEKSNIWVCSFWWPASWYWENRGLAGAMIKFPLWAPFLMFCIPPAVAFVQGPLRRYRRRNRNQCIQCGYSLTGNTSGICPECGMQA